MRFASLNPYALFRARPPDRFDLQRRLAGFFRDRDILFADHGARGLVAIEAAQHRKRNPAVGTLRTVLVADVEQRKFTHTSRSRFASHGVDPVVDSCSGVRQPKPGAGVPGFAIVCRRRAWTRLSRVEDARGRAYR